MTEAIGRLKAHLLNWRDWEFNPIVIKELRQGVRGWTVTGMLLLFLVVLFVTSVGFLVSESFDVNPNMQLGGTMFSVFTVILAVASIFFIPLYTGVRVAAERMDNNPDLLYVTTLSPSRIILGKFLCSAYIAVLFFSACMPFMAFTNLLRGVDLPTVFFLLAFLFLVVCVASMFAIFLACLPASRPFKVLFVLYGFFQCIGVIGTLVAVAFDFMRSGVGAMMASSGFWGGVLVALLVALLVWGLFFRLAVALVSPPSANRALPVRLYITAMWLAGGVMATVSVFFHGRVEVLGTWTIPAFLLLMFSLLVVVSNHDRLSLRSRRAIPAGRWQRAAAFLFFNGAAGGLVWVGLLLTATGLWGKFMFGLFPSTGYASYDFDHIGWFLPSALYAMGYALTALFIHRRFFPRRVPKLAGLLTVLLPAFWAIAPGVFLFFTKRLTSRSFDSVQLGNVFNIYMLKDDSQLDVHVLFGVGWLLVMLFLNARWFREQVTNFRPYEPLAVPPVISP